MVETHKLKYLSIGLVFADAYPLRLTLFHKASRAVTGRTGLTAGIATHALFHFFGKIGPALFYRFLFKFINIIIFRIRIHGGSRLTDHDIGNNRIVEAAGFTTFG